MLQPGALESHTAVLAIDLIIPSLLPSQQPPLAHTEPLAEGYFHSSEACHDANTLSWPISPKGQAHIYMYVHTVHAIFILLPPPMTVPE